MTDKHTCFEPKRGTGRFGYPPVRCGKTAKVQDDKGNWFCGIHSPEAKAKRRNKSDERYAAWSAECDSKRKKELEDKRRLGMFDEMLSALRRASLALAFASETSEAMRDDYEAVDAAIKKATGAEQ